MRTYDSRDKRRGDFGVGWTLGLKGDVRVQQNRPAGGAWIGTKTPDAFPLYCISPTAPHWVSVTLPNERVYQFEANVSPACQPLVPIQQVTVSFVPVPGTDADLEPVGNRQGESFDPFPGPIDLIDVDTLFPLDFQRCRLTLRDGHAFVVDRQAGLVSVADPNGNSIVFIPDDLTHSSGTGVTLQRDGQARITRATNPKGQFLAYAYSTAGDLASVTDQVGNTTTFTHNASHGLLGILDPLGRQPVRSEYDASGRRSFDYDAHGNKLSETNPLGQVTTRLWWNQQAHRVSPGVVRNTARPSHPGGCSRSLHGHVQRVRSEPANTHPDL